MIVLDTAPLFYWTMDPERLSVPAVQAISGADSVLVSSISLWEIGLKAQRGKLKMPLSIRELAARLAETDRVRVLPVDQDIWIDNVELKWEHRDPADRTIVATARHFGCPLVTPDERILVFYPNAIW